MIETNRENIIKELSELESAYLNYIIALCRAHHEQAHDSVLSKEYLQIVHKMWMLI